MARQSLPLPQTVTTLCRILLGLCLAPILAATDHRPLLEEALAAEARLDAAGALQLFRQADAAKPGDAFILQKIAKQYSDMVPDQPTDEAKKDFATRALGYARRSFELEPTNAVYALSLAICHGHLAVASDVRTKVEMSRLIKDDATLSLRLDPNYAWAHHILGRWHYEVASLGATARFFARLLYGGIPPASVDEGIKHLKRAVELEPGELNHWIDLGFAYATADRMTEARTAWEHGLAMPDRGKHDPTAKRRAREALGNR
jgi:tetratricopeptide (TPR) repeat protein